MRFIERRSITFPATADGSGKIYGDLKEMKKVFRQKQFYGSYMTFIYNDFVLTPAGYRLAAGLTGLVAGLGIYFGFIR